jgi:hypothetical protein
VIPGSGVLLKSWLMSGNADLDAIRQRLAELAEEHRDLDDVIRRLSLEPVQDELQLRRLKKRKLMLKDRMMQLECQLVPDISA